ncbi:MAG: DUF5682 family protein [Bifidobacteriaceae bacterium]|jgi:hypothetical protein|nr:DUF5682 family protein [Bifidobacteriaceae bacterium]
MTAAPQRAVPSTAGPPPSTGRTGLAGVPPRLERAFALLAELQGAGVHFVPIRHHSPACAAAARALIETVKPDAVLIEGPAQFNALLPLLTSPATEPPVAILTLAVRAGDQRSGLFYPLADFSPEWVALREASALGARVAFIDRQPEPDWAGLGDGDGFGDGHGDAGVALLRGERYFAESQTLAELARREHCRDHDELWDHLFELRGPEADWPELLRDVFAWSALARLDYEPEVLEAEGSAAREEVMAGHIRRWRGSVTGPIVVVTGAFHTLALVESLGPGLAGAHSAELTVRQAEAAGEAWLIRYSLDQLASQTGYGAGISSPGYRQRQWDAPAGGERLAAECLASVAQRVAEARTSESISVAQVMEATLHAERLAALRGHRRPGRADLLDACTSCFAAGDPGAALRRAVQEVFGGDKQGRVPPEAPAPPLVAEARAAAKALRFDLSAPSPRTTTLDVRGSARGRRRSRFLWLMAFLDVGFARRLSGPDYVAGVSLARAREQWEYTWTPMVEAALASLAREGATLADAARRRLRAQLGPAPATPDGQSGGLGFWDAPAGPGEDGAGRRALGGGMAGSGLAGGEARPSAGAVAEVVAQAALIGLENDLAPLEELLERVIDQDSDLGSVLAAARRLMGLCRAAELLDLAEPERLEALAARAVPQLVYLLSQLGSAREDREAEAVEALVGVHELVGKLEDQRLAELLRGAFARLRAAQDVGPGLLGALMALGVTEGAVADAALAGKLRGLFAPGSDPALAMRFFQGLMRAAPDLVLHTPELFQVVDQALDALDERDFLGFLPELRGAFARLRPRETAALAARVAAGPGGAGGWGLGQEAADVTEADLALGTAVELMLRHELAADGLTDWAGQ